MLDVQPLDRVDRLGAVDVQLDLLAHHHFGQLGLVGVPGGDVADILALRRMATRSLMDSTSCSLWVMMITALPSAFMLRMTLNSFSVSCGVRTAVGLVQNQDIRATVEHLDDLQRLLLADAHLVDLLVKVEVELIFSQMARALSWTFQVEFRRLPMDRAIFSVAENTSTSLKCWWIIPMPRSSASRGERMVTALSPT